MGLCAAAGLAIAAPALPVAAQSVVDVSDICSDPLSAGDRKRAMFQAEGWTMADPATAPIDGIARVHITTFTGGINDFQARLDLAPQLAGNLRNMIATGGADLLTLNGHYLAILINETDAGLEHLTCLYASPPNDALFDIMLRYGTPDDQTYPNYTVLQFNETAFVMDPDRTYEMVSIWSRLDLPLSATDTLTDAYRLERVETPAE
jgi:hypothetical protein